MHPNNESKKQELEIEELSYIVTKFNNDANISNIMNLNNFSDKILIKNYINQNILEKKNIQSFKLNNKTYKFIYKLIQFIPKYFIRLFK